MTEHCGVTTYAETLATLQGNFLAVIVASDTTATESHNKGPDPITFWVPELQANVSIWKALTHLGEAEGEQGWVLWSGLRGEQTRLTAQTVLCHAKIFWGTDICVINVFICIIPT